MNANRKRNTGSGKGVVVGVAIGLLFALVFKKWAIAVLIGIGVAYIFYTQDRR
jgi:hypothetical protein